jgi:antitoxin component of RelBE/YafQ-DinJ toxin-antitoxin module
MGKLNRGETTKLSIRLTAKAKERIELAAENLNLSKAGVIMFVLSKILKEEHTKSSLLNLENNLVLERENFAVTIKKSIAEDIDRRAKELDMRKNKFVGLLVSNYVENYATTQNLYDEEHDHEPYKMKVEVNNELKKKMMAFSEKYYFPLSGIVSLSVLKSGPYDRLPVYEEKGKDFFFTRIPTYIMERIKKEAKENLITESFYVELCLYKAFMSEERIFDL